MTNKQLPSFKVCVNAGISCKRMTLNAIKRRHGSVSSVVKPIMEALADGKKVTIDGVLVV